MSSAAPVERGVHGWPVAFRGTAAIRAGLVTPGQLRGPRYLRLFPTARYPGARGCARLSRVVGLADARAGSPMETRMRLVLVLRGLPPPEVQYPVQDERRKRVVWLDLAYPQQRIGIEYEGAEHTRPERVLRDIGRYTGLVDRGWRVFRFTKRDVYGEPDELAAKIRRALASRWASASSGL